MKYGPGDDRIETRQDRRERKLQKKRERMPKHGKGLARLYMDAILKATGLKGKGKK